MSAYEHLEELMNTGDFNSFTFNHYLAQFVAEFDKHFGLDRDEISETPYERLAR